MIIKAKRGNSAEGLLVYQRRLKGTPAEQAGVRLFDKNGIHTVENAAAVLDRLAVRSQRKSPIVHLIIRAERGLSDPEWRTALTAALEEAGLQANAWIAFLHDNDDDDPGDHMHIAAVAADRDGKPPPRFLRSASLDRRVTSNQAKDLPKGDVRSRAWDSQLRRRLMSIARGLEDELGLRPLARDRAAQMEPVRVKAKVSQGARDRERRTGRPALADLIDTLATQAALEMPDYSMRSAALAKLDLEIRPSFRANGDLSGLRLYRSSDPSLHCAASALGARYSLKRLDERSSLTFMEWYRADRPTPAVGPTRTDPNNDLLRARYDEYARDVAAQRHRLVQERVAVAAWQKRKRAEALKRRKAAVPIARTRSERILRATASRICREQYAQIDADAQRQREALGTLVPHRLNFVDWLATQAGIDPAAERKYEQLRNRSAAVPASVVPVSTVPVNKPSAAAPQTPAEQAARVAEQERLLRQTDALKADNAILRHAEAIVELTSRLAAIGVRLIVDADRNDRRVRVEANKVTVDELTMTTNGTKSPSVLLQASITHRMQIDEEDRLPIKIHSAMGTRVKAGQTPAGWLQDLYGEAKSIRWLTSAQDAAIRNGWKVLADEKSQRDEPLIPSPRPDLVRLPVLSSDFPVPTVAVAPAIGKPSVEPSSKVRAGDRHASPPSASAKRDEAVREATAAMRSQRPATAPPQLPLKRSAAPANNEVALIPQDIAPAVPVAPQPVSTRQPMPSQQPAIFVAGPGEIVKDPAPAVAPSVPLAPRPVRPKTAVAPEAALIGQWLAASEEARFDPSRQPDSDALAARLIMQDDLNILDMETQERAKREAEAHRIRLAQITQRASDNEASLPIVDVPPNTDMETSGDIKPSPFNGAIDTTLKPPINLQRAVQLGHLNRGMDGER